VPAQISLLERESEALRLQKKAPHRWLHPNSLDWPERSLDEFSAGLPVLNWSAGFAPKVAETVLSALDHEKGGLGSLISYSVNNIVTRKVDNHWELSWSCGPVPEQGDFDLLVWSIGFGRDKSQAGESGGYWDYDANLFEAIHSRGHSERWVVAGAGDGGLIDAIRILRDGEPVEPWATELFNIESVRAAALGIKDRELYQSSQDVHSFYSNLRLEEAERFLKGKRLRDAEVEIITTRRDFYGPGTSHLNRLLVSQIANLTRHIRFHEGRVV
jgi:hypothetical protein